jgi:hypothetical protein
MELDLDSEVAALKAGVGLDIHTLYHSRITRSTAQSKKKKKKKKGTPLHLQWSADEDGDDEEPVIIAPGWNLPQYVPRGRGRTYEGFEKDVESSETEVKTTKSSKPKTQGKKSKVEKENEMDPRKAAAFKNALIGEGIIR